MRLNRSCLAVLAGCSLLACTPTVTPTPAPQLPTPTPGPARPAGAPTGVPNGAPAGEQAPGGPGGAGGQDPAPKPYDQVVTAAAKSRDGLVKTHRIGGRLLFEIPKSALDNDIIVVPRIAKAPEGMIYGGQQVSATRVVRWERRENRVLLRSVSFNLMADPSLPVAKAVEASNYGPLLGVFNVEAYGKDSAAVIDVTRFFTAPPPDLGPGGVLKGVPDPGRSLIERVATFPLNVEVEALLTAAPVPNPSQATNPFGIFGPQPNATVSLVMHWSMVKLPEQPMMPRLADSRVGYFSTTTYDYGRPEQRAQQRAYITRYRLEKKDPGAAVSDPVKPIVYYVDPATPKWLVPWVKRGIESWQPAFFAAGFRRGIVAKDAPSPEEDPDWSPEDARYSVIRWHASTIENAVGPNVHDPRSGEIIEADVYMFHNIMNLQRSWYFTQVGHLDPRARMWPFPDSLMGRLVQYVVAHEVGHTLGFPHNQKASSTYPVDSVRSRTWVKKMGHTPTLMDYSRFNYTAQPEDSIDLADLTPGIGPYDIYATKWGYSPIPTAKTPDDERPTLDRWAREQDQTPWFRFNVTGSMGSDPGDQTEAVGDGDAVKATGWGMKNIKRIAPLLMPAAVHDGEDYDDLRLLYDRLVSQWATELRHVSNVVGGADAQEKYGGQTGVRFAPLPRPKQKAAVQFLAENAFATPTYFLDPDILRRIEVEGALRRINAAQTGILASLFNDRRLERMIEFEALSPAPAQSYSLGEMLADARQGIWKELSAPKVTIDPFRRELGRSYLAQVKNKINPAPVSLPPGLPPEFAVLVGPARSTSDIRALFRSELKALDAQIRTALPRSANPETRAHLEDAHDEIERILKPEK